MKVKHHRKVLALSTTSEVITPAPIVKPRWYTDEERVKCNCDLQFVYVLKDPTVRGRGEVFYVGRTKHLLERYIQHVRGSNDGSAKDERIRIITRAGYLPIMETVHHACTEKEAVFREAFYIHYYLAAGMPLTNQVVALDNNGYQGKDRYELEQWDKRYYKRSRFLIRWFHRLTRGKFLSI